MIYLLLGSDSFGKKEFLNELAEKQQTPLVLLSEDIADAETIISSARGGGLFGGKEIIVAYNFLGKNLEAAEELIGRLQGLGNDVVFLDGSLDKRKKETKKILADKRVKVLEFAVPSGVEFKKWVDQRAKKYGLKFGAGAEGLLLERLGLGAGEFGNELYDLWQTDSELRKLKVFAGDNEISREAVQSLVSENIDENVFKLTNAIGDKNKPLALKFLSDYMDRLAGIDDKTKIISLSALLAEQFRNVLLIQSLLEDRASEKKISDLTGFSPGRVFIMKKLASRFATAKVREALMKLEYLDEELKTSQAPSSLQFLMIVEGSLR